MTYHQVFNHLQHLEIPLFLKVHNLLFNIQDGLSQIATALSVIEPTLQKYIVKKIEDIKEEDVAEAQTAGAKSARTYTQSRKTFIS